jgi:hydrogenase nickel incorporation protein HypA/HybF
MLEIALDAAAEAGGGRIREIHLVIGDLTSMVDDSVQFYFDLLSKGTPAEGAMLRFVRESAVLDCHGCGLSKDVQAPLPAACPRCGDLRLEVSGGQAFFVESIDLDPDACPEPHAPEHESPLAPSGGIR